LGCKFWIFIVLGGGLAEWVFPFGLCGYRLRCDFMGLI